MPRPPVRADLIPKRGRQFSLGPNGSLPEIRDVKPLPVRDDWHYDAYTYSKAVPPVRYVLRAKADLLSRCLIRAERRVPNSEEWAPTEDARALRVARAFVDENGSQGELLRQACAHAEKAGVAWLYGDPVKDPRGRIKKFNWSFKSMSELKVERRGDMRVQSWGRGVDEHKAPPDGIAERCLFYPDDEYSDRPTSPVFSILPQMKQWVLAEQVIDAICRSKLPAGLMFIPDEVSFGPTVESDNPGNPAEGVDEFDAEFHEHTSRAATDQTSATRLNPLFMRGPAMVSKGDKSISTLSAMGLVNISRDLDGYLSTIREELVQIMAQGLDCPPETLLGKGGLNHWCADDSTEILTEDGWKTHDQVSPGDMVLTLNHDSGMSEWQPVSAMNRFDVVDEEMLSIEGRFHSSLTTLNHRWPVIHRVTKGEYRPDGRVRTWEIGRERRWTTSGALKTNDNLVTGAVCSEIPSELKWSDAFVEVMAWYWTEGSCRRRPGVDSPQVIIWQDHVKNPYYVARIRSALTEVFGSSVESLGKGGFGPRNEIPQWRERQRNGNGRALTEFRLNASAGDVVVAVAPDRKVPLSFIRELTFAQLELFLDVSIRADGHMMGGCSPMLTQKNPDLLAAVELAAALTGKATHFYRQPFTDDQGRKRERWAVSWRERNTYNLQRLNKRENRVRYTGMVWCPTTDNGSWFARRNGHTFYTGNSGWNIDSDFISKNVVPLGTRILELVTVKYYRPMLMLTGMSAEDAEWFHLALDPAPITADPDKSAVATEAWQQIRLSDSAWVSYLGLDESEMPDEEELARRSLERIMFSQPTTTPNVMRYLYPNVDFGDTFDGWTVGQSAPGGANLPSASMPSSKGMPEPRGPLLSLSPSLLKSLVVAADRDMVHALEQAGQQLIGKVNGSDPTGELRRAPKAEVLTVAGASVVRQAGFTGMDLFAGAFDDLGLRVTDWLTADMVERGVDPDEARQRAQASSNELVSQLQLCGAGALDRPLRVGPNGTRISDDMVLSALAAGDLLTVDTTSA